MNSLNSPKMRKINLKFSHIFVFDLLLTGVCDEIHFGYPWLHRISQPIEVITTAGSPWRGNCSDSCWLLQSLRHGQNGIYQSRQEIPWDVDWSKLFFLGINRPVWVFLFLHRLNVALHAACGPIWFPMFFKKRLRPGCGSSEWASEAWRDCMLRETETHFWNRWTLWKCWPTCTKQNPRYRIASEACRNCMLK